MKIGVLGGSGRMGRLIIQKILEIPEIKLTGIGIHQQKASSLDFPDILITSDAEKVLDCADVVIDFTKAEALSGHLEKALKLKKAMVIGTTGLVESHKDFIKKASRLIPIVYASNMSLGLAVMTRLVEQVASILGPNFDIEILEMHHRHKKDAPSGTALSLGNAAAQGRNIPFNAHACFDRTCRTSSRPKNEIGFSVLRAGDIPGEHTVVFASDEEMITLSHRVFNREVFAKGAIKAALWLRDKEPGLYTMQDVLGL
jgi:4-hydroxy-tetrahydrodipicolinate reductase